MRDTPATPADNYFSVDCCPKLLSNVLRHSQGLGCGLILTHVLEIFAISNSNFNISDG
jgi:hypothetical protein